MKESMSEEDAKKLLTLLYHKNIDLINQDI